MKEKVYKYREVKCPYSEAVDRLENDGFPHGINAIVFLLHKPVMVCFAILIPMMTRSMEDALCAITYIGKVMKYSLMLLFATGFTIILAAFFNDRILENNIVKAMILIAVSAVPFKAFVDMFNKKQSDASCCG